MEQKLDSPSPSADGAKPSRKIYTITTPCCGKSISWEWGRSPEVCPLCGDKYVHKPGLEYKLFHLQDRMDAGDKTALTAMVPLLQEYSENKIKKALKMSGVAIPFDDLQEKAWETATKTVEFLLKGNRMTDSFGAMIERVMKGPMYEGVRESKYLSLDVQYEDTGYSTSDNLGRKNVEVRKEFRKYDPETRSDRVYVSQEITKVMVLTQDVIRSHYGQFQSTLFLVGLLGRLTKRPEPFVKKFYEEFGSDARNNIEKGELVIFKYLKDVVNDTSAPRG